MKSNTNTAEICMVMFLLVLGYLANRPSFIPYVETDL